MSLNDLLEQVNSKDTFLRFAEALAADFRDDGSTHGAGTAFVKIFRGNAHHG